MKKALTALALALGLTITTHAQTTNVVWETNTVIVIKTNSSGFLQLGGPLIDILKNVTTASNIAAYGYGTVGQGNKDFGGGVGVLYNFNDVVGTGVRIDYLSSTKTVYLPSFDLQLQAPIYFNSNHTVGLIPFGISGLATPIAGKNTANGTAVGIFGAGAAIKLTAHLDIVWDYEKWTGFKGSYQRFGVLYKF